MLNPPFDKITLINPREITIDLSSVCAVFAQSEIVELMVQNVSEEMIISAVLKHIFLQAKKLLTKLNCDALLLSGGFASIENIDEFATAILKKKCSVVNESNYISAIGCTLIK